jgi:hypothetical protein
MALRLSRRSIGAFSNQSNVGLTLAGPSRLQPRCCDTRHLNFVARGYAVAATKQKQKTPSTLKATQGNLASRTSARTTLAKPAAKGSRSPQPKSEGATTSRHASAPEMSQLPRKTPKASNHIAGGMSYKVPEKKDVLTEEEQMEQVDQIMAMAKLFPTADPWGQRVETLGGFLVSLYFYRRVGEDVLCAFANRIVEFQHQCAGKSQRLTLLVRRLIHLLFTIPYVYI